jgi:excisionase family DNA binding protein
MPEVEVLLYSVAETARALGLGENTVRKMVARGDLPARRINGRLLIPVEAVHALAGVTR